MLKQKKEHWEPKSRLSGILVFFALIIIGVFVGHFLCMLTASHSDMAKVISVIMLPLSAVAGYFVWQTTLLIYLGCKFGRSFLKGFKKAGLKTALSQKVEGMPPFPPFTFAFIFVSVSISLIVGLIIAFIPGGQGFFRVVCLYAIAGLVYGLLQRHLVLSGYFIALESDSGSYVKDKDTVEKE